MRWSYDALWQAANGQAIVVDGANKASHNVELVSHEENEDGTWTSVINVSIASTDLVQYQVDDVYVFWADYDDTHPYFEESLMYDVTDPENPVLTGAVVVSEPAEDGSLVITITSSAEIAAKYAGGMGFDVYYTESIGGGEPTSYLDSVYAEFPAAEAE
jgi:hypothetical protein